MSYEQSVAGLKREVQAKVLGNMVRNPFFAYDPTGFAAHWTNGVNGSSPSSIVGSAGTASHVLTMPSNAIVESEWFKLGSGQDNLPLPNFTVSLYARTSVAPPVVLKVELVDSIGFVAAVANFTPGNTNTLQTLPLIINPSVNRTVKLRITAPVGSTSIGLICLVPGDVEPSIFSDHAVTDGELYAELRAFTSNLVVGAHHHPISDVEGLQPALDSAAAALITETAARVAGDIGSVQVVGDQVVHNVKTFDGSLRASNAPNDSTDVVRRFDIQNSSVEPYASMGYYTSQSGSGNLWNATPLPFIERFHSGVNLDYDSATNQFVVAKSGVYRLAANMLVNGRVSTGNGYLWIKIQSKPGGSGSWVALNQDITTNASPGESLDQDHATEWIGYLTAGDVVCVMVNHDYYWTHLVHFTCHYLGQPAPTSALTIITGDITLHAQAGDTYPINGFNVASLVAANSQGTVTWSVVPGPGTTLPGATIASGNTLKGDFASDGSWLVTVQAVDANTTATKLLHVTLVAYAAIPLTIGAADTKSYSIYTTSLPYTDSILFAPSGGTPPYGYNFVAGSTTAPAPSVSGTDVNGQFNYTIPAGTAAGTYNYTARLTLNDTVSGVNKDIAIAVTLLTSGGGGDGGGGCVPAGTKFKLADGSELPIEQITPGMVALAYDDKTGYPVENAIITQTFEYKSRALWKIKTTLGEIITSWDHRPWRVEDAFSVTGNNHFPRVEELKAGETLKWLTQDGRIVDTEILSVAATGEVATVYHVNLSSGHIYVAGNLLAHNMKSQYI